MPIFGEAVRKPWKLAWVKERLEDAQILEAQEPGYHGQEVEVAQRWYDDVVNNEDSDSTDEDWRPPLERKVRESYRPGGDPFKRKNRRGIRESSDEEDSSE